MSLPLPALEAVERERIATLEATIELGIRTFVEVGSALSEIRDARLYRFTHGTFEDYVSDRWEMSRSKAYRLIEGAEVARLMSPNGDTPRPATEAVARELASLAHSDPDAAREAYSAAVEASGGRPTAAIVREVVTATRESRIGPLMTSDTDEWKTPAEVVARVLRAFPVIDLDPCAERGHVKNVPAIRHLTIEDDGLEYGWQGRVFANPPYSRVQQFAEKVAAEHANITEAIVLVPARTETRWWRVIPASVVCFFHGRLKFLPESGEAKGAATFPSAALYVGRDPERFVRAFADLGLLYERIDA